MDNRKDDRVFRFCYDTKTETGYTTAGNIDDLNHISDTLGIRLFANVSDRFYYLHTDFQSAEAGEELNPTLYIGILKK